MGHVAEEQGADLVGDRPELVRLDRARVRRAAADDQLRPVLLREPQHLVVVDDVRLARDAVVDDRVEPAGEVDLEPVRQVAAVRELEREDRVARLERGHVDGHVRLRARVRLHVRVLGAEQLLRAVDRGLLDLVDDLAAAVVAPAGIALGVLVRRHRADRLEHGRPGEVLGRDQLDLPALALELAPEQLRDLRVDLRQPGGLQVLDRFLRDGHSAPLLARGGSYSRREVTRGRRPRARAPRPPARRPRAAPAARRRSGRAPSTACRAARPRRARRRSRRGSPPGRPRARPRVGPPWRFALVAATAPTASSTVASPAGSSGTRTPIGSGRRRRTATGTGAPGSGGRACTGREKRAQRSRSAGSSGTQPEQPLHARGEQRGRLAASSRPLSRRAARTGSSLNGVAQSP